jgi:hypothetical protein
MTLMLGTHCVFERALEADPQRLERLVALITDPRWLYRFKLIDIWHTPQQPPVPVFKGTVPAAAREWLELQHELIALVGGLNAVIVATTSSDIVGIETSLVDRWVDGRSMHPDPGEIGAYATRRRKLGNEYVRAPRWGTYLKPEHVTAIGGRDRIVSVVKPPVVRDVGDLLYVQLSERVSDALAPETEARRLAFADLLAPITMPRLES